MRRVLIVLSIVLALVVAACGGGNGDGAADGNGGATTAAPSASAGGGDATHGEELYQGTCVACHGADAKGIEGLGKDLTSSEFIQGMSDDELVAFIKAGRPASDPANTTGVDMPPNGGNPALTDQDLLDIVAFLRTLQ